MINQEKFENDNSLETLLKTKTWLNFALIWLDFLLSQFYDAISFIKETYNDTLTERKTLK